MATTPALGEPSTPTRVTSSTTGDSEQTPTSTLASPSASANQADARRPSFLASTASTSAGWTLARTVAQQQLSVRADPALLTCFDPADRELYDLWAPKRGQGV